MNIVEKAKAVLRRIFGTTEKCSYVTLVDGKPVRLEEGGSYQGVNLQGANLRGAHLGPINFEGADLSGAYLDGAYLRGANFKNAKLHHAVVSAADFTGAKFDTDDGVLRDVIATIPPLGIKVQTAEARLS